MMSTTVSVPLQAFAWTSVLSAICKLTHKMNIIFFLARRCCWYHRCFQNEYAHGAGQPAVGDSAWLGELDKMTSRGPRQPQPVCDSLFVTPQSLHFDSNGITIETSVPFYSINGIHSTKWAPQEW